MDQHTTQRIEHYLQIFAREAGRQALELQRGLNQVSAKGDGELHASSIVTEADGQIGRFAEEFFGAAFPGCVVIQEETADGLDMAGAGPDTLFFIVDPIDGTLFYAKGGFAWAISVGCFHGWRPVASCIHAPQAGGMYYTQDGQSFLNDAPIRAFCPAGSLKGSLMLRHIRPRHEIVDFPGYVLSYGSVALHLALVASGYACACVTARHYVHDVAGAAKLLENAGAELRQLNGAPPPWQELITHPNQRSPEAFFACPQGAFERLAGYVRAR